MILLSIPKYPEVANRSLVHGHIVLCLQFLCTNTRYPQSLLPPLPASCQVHVAVPHSELSMVLDVRTKPLWCDAAVPVPLMELVIRHATGTHSDERWACARARLCEAAPVPAGAVPLPPAPKHWNECSNGVLRILPTYVLQFRLNRSLIEAEKTAVCVACPPFIGSENFDQFEDGCGDLFRAVGEEQVGRALYRLVAVLVHVGVNFNAGHWISHVRFPSQVLAQGPSAAADDVYGGLIEVEGAHTWKRCSDDHITNIVLRTSGAIVPPTV